MDFTVQSNREPLRRRLFGVQVRFKHRGIAKRIVVDERLGPHAARQNGFEAVSGIQIRYRLGCAFRRDGCFAGCVCICAR